MIIKFLNLLTSICCGCFIKQCIICHRFFYSNVSDSFGNLESDICSMDCLERYYFVPSSDN